MKRTLLLYCFVLFFLSCDKKEKEKFDLVISHANIVDVASGEIIKDMTIFISGDSIRKVINTSEAQKYKADKEINAEGKFVMPGLWDMHVHFRGGDSLIKENKNFLPVFLSYGVTTVRDAGGDISLQVLEWRKAIANAELTGPRIFTPGPKLDGENPAWPGSISVTTEAEVSAALDSLEAMNVDFVKAYDGSLTPEMFYAIIKESNERGLKMTGHMPLTADFMKAVEMGLDGAEHMYYPLMATSPLVDSLRQLNKGYAIMVPVIESYDKEMAKNAFQEMAVRKLYVTPTLHIGKTLAQILEIDHTKDTLLPYIGTGIQKTYQGRIEGAKRAQASGSTMREKMEQKSAEMIVPMQQAGILLLAGSDSGAFNSYVYPGESLHGELRELVAAGLTPQQALETSVINGPKFFNLENSYGSIAEGKVADILILEANPLKDIKNVSRINAVVRLGKVYDREKLNAQLQAVKN